MEKINIQLYTNLDHHEETCNLLAIKNDDVIKYNDLENNRIIVNMQDNTMTRENNDYHFLFDFNANNIIINLKAHHRLFNKEIKTLFVERKKNSYTIKYLLVDENVINEYHLKF